MAGVKSTRSFTLTPCLAKGGGALGMGSAKAVLIVQTLRLPRTFLAILVGGSLGLAGAVLQGFLRNPLAEPATIGVSPLAVGRAAANARFDR